MRRFMRKMAWGICLVPALVILAVPLTAQPVAAKDDIKLGESRHIFLDTIVVSVLSDMRVRGLLSVDVGLELSNPDDRENILKIVPRLRDQYLQVLSTLASNRIDVSRPVDIDAINRVLQSVTNRTLGTDKARVLVGGASVRRL